MVIFHSFFCLPEATQIGRHKSRTCAKAVPPSAARISAPVDCTHRKDQAIGLSNENWDWNSKHWNFYSENWDEICEISPMKKRGSNRARCMGIHHQWEVHWKRDPSCELVYVHPSNCRSISTISARLHEWSNNQQLIWDNPSMLDRHGNLGV